MKKKVSVQQWLAVLAVFAADVGITVEQAASRRRYHNITAARRDAFQHFLGRGYSVYSLARASGFSVSMVKVAGDAEFYRRRMEKMRARYYTKKAELAGEQCVPQRLAA